MSLRSAMRALQVPLLMAAGSLLVTNPARAQSDNLSFAVFVPSEVDTLNFALQKKTLLLLNVVLSDSFVHAGVLELGKPMGEVVHHPMEPEGSLAALISASTAAYDRGDFAVAEDIAREGIANDSTNPFALEALARALFSVAETRLESRTVYERLLNILDHQVEVDTLGEAIRIDLHFVEAYSKIGALLLDAGDHERATFELTKSLYAAISTRASGQFVELQLAYLTEAYTELGMEEVARWFAGATLFVNPQNQYVLPYLERLGPGSDGILACEAPADSTPGKGMHSLSLGANVAEGELACSVPPAYADGSVVPCLRIAKIYVGQSETEVIGNVGHGWQEVGQVADRDVFVRPVFQDVERREAAYYVLEYERHGGERIVYSVQITGQQPPLPHLFSCLELGDLAKDVRRQIGDPNSVEDFHDPKVDVYGELWRFDPYPITIEVVQGRIYSIRVSRPDNVAPQRREWNFLRPQ